MKEALGFLIDFLRRFCVWQEILTVLLAILTTLLQNGFVESDDGAVYINKVSLSIFSVFNILINKVELIYFQEGDGGGVRRGRWRWRGGGGSNADNCSCPILIRDLL